VPAGEYRLPVQPRALDRAKQVAIQGFNAGTCNAWDLSFASALVRADATAMGVFGMGGCGVTEPANAANVYNVATRTGSIRCDVFQTNANLLGTIRGATRAGRSTTSACNTAWAR